MYIDRGGEREWKGRGRGRARKDEGKGKGRAVARVGRGIAEMSIHVLLSFLNSTLYPMGMTSAGKVEGKEEEKEGGEMEGEGMGKRR